MIRKLILKYFPYEERFWEVFRFLLVGGGCFVLEYVLLYTLAAFLRCIQRRSPSRSRSY